MKGKYFRIFIIVFSILILGFAFSFLEDNGKGAKNIQITGNRVIMDLDKKHINAELAPKFRESFLVDSGDAFSNIGEFYVVPMERAKYLEQSYPEFLDCHSFDNIEGYKNSIMYVGFIAMNQNAEIEMKEAAKFLHKGVAEMMGSKLKIEGQKEAPDVGILNLIGKNPSIYYLIDEIKIIDIEYQKGKNY